MRVGNWKKIGLWVLLVNLCCVVANAAGHTTVAVPKDSVSGAQTTSSEYTHIYKTRKVTSTYPISVQMKGGSLIVTSHHYQMLPVYKGNGVFYGMFRLEKGTNWISGLPKGTYIINNSKYKVS